jgi:hypothetical protein
MITSPRTTVVWKRSAEDSGSRWPRFGQSRPAPRRDAGSDRNVSEHLVLTNISARHDSANRANAPRGSIRNRPERDRRHILRGNRPPIRKKADRRGRENATDHHEIRKRELEAIRTSVSSRSAIDPLNFGNRIRDRFRKDTFREFYHVQMVSVRRPTPRPFGKPHDRSAVFFGSPRPGTTEVARGESRRRPLQLSARPLPKTESPQGATIWPRL